MRLQIDICNTDRYIVLSLYFSIQKCFIYNVWLGYFIHEEKTTPEISGKISNNNYSNKDPLLHSLTVIMERPCMNKMTKRYTIFINTNFLMRNLHQLKFKSMKILRT